MHSTTFHSTRRSRERSFWPDSKPAQSTCRSFKQTTNTVPGSSLLRVQLERNAWKVGEQETQAQMPPSRLAPLSPVRAFFPATPLACSGFFSQRSLCARFLSHDAGTFSIQRDPHRFCRRALACARLFLSEASICGPTTFDKGQTFSFRCCPSSSGSVSSARILLAHPPDPDENERTTGKNAGSAGQRCPHGDNRCHAHQPGACSATSTRLRSRSPVATCPGTCHVRVGPS